MKDEERLKEQIRIKEQARFFTEKKELVDSYRREKEKQGYSVEVYPAQPKGWIVTSHLHLAIGGN